MKKALSSALVSVAMLFSVPALAANIPFENLSPRQQELVSGYLRAAGFKSWEKMPESMRTTYAAITHALEHVALSDGTPALELVTSVLSVHGEIPGAESAEQFNLEVSWADGAQGEFFKIGYWPRPGWGHSAEHGFSYHCGSTGLHVLFNDVDGNFGHVHVDYRDVGLSDLLGHGEGHYNAYNADVRAVGPETDQGLPIDNLSRHAEWFGMIPGFSR